MGRYQKIYDGLSVRRADFPYSELKVLLTKCGCELKAEHATHSIFKHAALREHLNIVRKGNCVKLPCYVDDAKTFIDKLIFMGVIDFLEGDE